MGGLCSIIKGRADSDCPKAVNYRQGGNPHNSKIYGDLIDDPIEVLACGWLIGHLASYFRIPDHLSWRPHPLVDCNRRGTEASDYCPTVETRGRAVIKTLVHYF